MPMILTISASLPASSVLAMPDSVPSSELLNAVDDAAQLGNLAAQDGFFPPRRAISSMVTAEQAAHSTSSGLSPSASMYAWYLARPRRPPATYQRR